MNELSVFKNQEFGSVGAIKINNKPYFCGKDVAGALGYEATRNAIAKYCKGALKRCVLTNGGKQEMYFIPESDVYRLVFRSKLPNAERFTDWVVESILPSIRSTGGYIAGQEEMNEDELLEAALNVARRRIEEQKKIIGEQQNRIAEMKPKEIFADAVTTAKSSILIGELAKILRQNGVDTGQTRLFKTMRDEGYLIKRAGSDYNMPTQRSMELGLFEIKETAVTHSDGSIRVSKTPKVTGKGQQYFINKFLNAKPEEE